MYGSSIGFAPILVIMKNLAAVAIRVAFDLGLNLEDDFIFFFIDSVVIIKILIISAITPPILLGIPRRIAYANRKYHSGWMWTGVTIGLAVIKFSGSISVSGHLSVIMIAAVRITVGAKISLIENFGWNGVISIFLCVPIGFDDPFECRVIRWINIIVNRINGIKKWSGKNRFSVGFPTENPPQNHCTMSFPQIGIADIRFVITVAPQKDICPHGSTYPMKAVPIRMKMIDTPDIHVSVFLYDEFSRPRNTCMNISAKNREAMFEWIVRVKSPQFTSREMWVVDSNAIDVSGV